MNPIAMTALADEHIRELRTEAAYARLVALARCCQPATWRRAARRTADAVRRLATWIRASQLGPANNYCAC